MAASVLAQPLVTPHCQEAPPILGPLPRSTVGMTTRSSPSAARALSAAHEPVYSKPLLLFRKSWVESLPLFVGHEALVRESAEPLGPLDGLVPVEDTVRRSGNRRG